MYPSTTLFIALGQFAIVVLVLFSYPLQVHPCRNCLDKVFAPKDKIADKVVASAADEDDSDDEDVDPDHAGGEMSGTRLTVLTAAIVTFGFIIAYLVDDLQLGKHTTLTYGLDQRLNKGPVHPISSIVLSFVGSTGSTTISFILPGLFYFKVCDGSRSLYLPSKASLPRS